MTSQIHILSILKHSFDKELLLEIVKELFSYCTPISNKDERVRFKYPLNLLSIKILIDHDFIQKSNSLLDPFLY